MDEKSKKWLMVNIVLLAMLGTILTFAACSRRVNAPSEVVKYYETVDEIVGVFPDCETKFVDVMPNGLPLNSIGASGGNRVLLLRSYWVRATDLDREQLMLHELGHCTFHLGHIENSIMQPMHIPLPVYKTHRDEYVRQYKEMVENKYGRVKHD